MLAFPISPCLLCAALWIKCSCTVWVLFFGSMSDFGLFFQMQTLIPCLFASSQSASTCPIRLCEQTAGWFGASWLPMDSMRWVQWTSDLILCQAGRWWWCFWVFCGFFFFFNSAGLEPGSCCGPPCGLMYSASQTQDMSWFCSLKGEPISLKPAKTGEKECWSLVMCFFSFCF